jgi:choline dehydrogenase
MGRDEMSVVDGDLKVYGIDNLRIADGSIMPRVTTGNTMAPCVIVGERAAEIIRGEHQIGTLSVSRSDRFTNNPEYWVQSPSPRLNFTSAVRFTDLG